MLILKKAKNFPNSGNHVIFFFLIWKYYPGAHNLKGRKHASKAAIALFPAPDRPVNSRQKGYSP